MPEQKSKKSFRPKPRLAKGFRDMDGEALAQERALIEKIAQVYETYGFIALDTPSFEYADALGKFLPDQERPNEGVFALEDDDGQWLSLRYDLTAPLARYVAEHYERLPKPFRRYQWGFVWRNEKPGPGRFRQFLQMDADCVGAASPAADAEICMIAADCMEALGLGGKYQIRINNRKLMDGLLAKIGIEKTAQDYETKRLGILRAIDKHDRLGLDGVQDLLGEGRRDESGDFTKGAGLTEAQSEPIIALLRGVDNVENRAAVIDFMEGFVGDDEAGRAGVAELRAMDECFTKLGYGNEKIAISPPVVRGLGYYTGAVFEIELNFEIIDETGKSVPFGSVGGGGRYDDLVKRFKGVEVPATGISIGVSRLAAALRYSEDALVQNPPVVVLVLEEARRNDMLVLAAQLRKAGISAETYMGDSGLKAQLRYADKRGAVFVLLEGESERAKNTITIKDLRLGAENAAHIADNAQWRESAHAQSEVGRAEIVAHLQKHLKNS